MKKKDKKRKKIDEERKRHKSKFAGESKKWRQIKLLRGTRSLKVIQGLSMRRETRLRIAKEIHYQSGKVSKRLRRYVGSFVRRSIGISIRICVFCLKKDVILRPNIAFSSLDKSLHLFNSSCPSVCPLVCPSIHPTALNVKQ